MIHKHSLTTLQSLNICCKVHHNNRNPRNPAYLSNNNIKTRTQCVHLNLLQAKVLKSSIKAKTKLLTLCRKSKSVGSTEVCAWRSSSLFSHLFHSLCYLHPWDFRCHLRALCAKSLWANTEAGTTCATTWRQSGGDHSLEVLLETWIKTWQFFCWCCKQETLRLFQHTFGTHP